MIITYTAPHWPWQGPNDKPYDDSVDFRKGGSPAVIYAAMMKSLDEGVGDIMKALQDDEQLSNQTIVIFTNDNGGENIQTMLAYRKERSVWEGGIRVPAFVRWPEKIKAGVVTEQIVISMECT